MGEGDNGDDDLSDAHIVYYLFADCSGITTLTLPEGITSIGDHAFYGEYSPVSWRVEWVEGESESEYMMAGG